MYEPYSKPALLLYWFLYKIKEYTYIYTLSDFEI